MPLPKCRWSPSTQSVRVPPRHLHRLETGASLACTSPGSAAGKPTATLIGMATPRPVSRHRSSGTRVPQPARERPRDARGGRRLACRISGDAGTQSKSTSTGPQRPVRGRSAARARAEAQLRADRALRRQSEVPAPHRRFLKGGGRSVVVVPFDSKLTQIFREVDPELNK